MLIPGTTIVFLEKTEVVCTEEYSKCLVLTNAVLKKPKRYNKSFIGHFHVQIHRIPYNIFLYNHFIKFRFSRTSFIRCMIPQCCAYFFQICHRSPLRCQWWNLQRNLHVTRGRFAWISGNMHSGVYMTSRNKSLPAGLRIRLLVNNERWGASAPEVITANIDSVYICIGGSVRSLRHRFCAFGRKE